MNHEDWLEEKWWALVLFGACLWAIIERAPPDSVSRVGLMVALALIVGVFWWHVRSQNKKS